MLQPHHSLAVRRFKTPLASANRTSDQKRDCGGGTASKSEAHQRHANMASQEEFFAGKKGIFQELGEEDFPDEDDGGELKVENLTRFIFIFY